MLPQLVKDVLGIKSGSKVNSEDSFNFPIKTIKDVMQDNENRFKLVAKVSPVNGELLTVVQLGEVADAIQGALVSFEGRIGIYIQSERVDIQANLSNIDKRKEELNSEFKILQLEEQRKSLAAMGNMTRNVLNFYVVLEAKEKNILTAEQILSDAFINVKNELESQEMFADRLYEHEIKELLYEKMNPESCQYEPYSEDWDIENIIPENTKRYKDGRHLEINNRIYRFYSITKYPTTVDKYRWLRKLFRIKGDINIAIILNPKNKATINKELSKAVDEASRKSIDPANDAATKLQYKAEEKSANDMIQELGSDNVNLYDVNITIGVSATDINELDTQCNIVRSRISSTYCQSTELKYKGFEPFFTILPLLADNIITRNYVWNLSTKDVASIIPFDSSELMESKGVLIGLNETSKGLVITNFRNRIYNNSHTCILADSGSGKSYFIMCDAIRNIPYVDYTILFDIKGDLVFPFGKRHIFSATAGTISNPFHIRNTVIDSESASDNGKNDVGAFLTQKIMDVIVFMKWIIKDMSTYDESLLEEDIRDAYEKCGLTFKSTELPTEFCTMSTLKEIQDVKIKNTEGMEKERRTFIRACLKPYTTGAYSKLFNGQTNWDFDEFTVFDISNIPEALKPPLYDILLKDTWQFCKKDGTKNPSKIDLYVDECHEFADEKNPQTLAFLSTKLIKQGRGFGVRVITATQNLPDFLSIPKYGQAIIDNSFFKLFMRLGESDLPVAQKLYHFSEGEMRVIKGSNTKKKGSKGKGIFICGSQRVIIQTRASKYELEIIDPEQFEEIYKVPSRYFNKEVEVI